MTIDKMIKRAGIKSGDSTIEIIEKIHTVSPKINIISLMAYVGGILWIEDVNNYKL